MKTWVAALLVAVAGPVVGIPSPVAAVGALQVSSPVASPAEPSPTCPSPLPEEEAPGCIVRPGPTPILPGLPGLPPSSPLVFPTLPGAGPSLERCFDHFRGGPNTTAHVTQVSSAPISS